MTKLLKYLFTITMYSISAVFVSLGLVFAKVAEGFIDLGELTDEAGLAGGGHDKINN